MLSDYENWGSKPDPVDILDGETQPQVKKKGYTRKPLVALKKCNVEFDDCIVELQPGCEVHGLKRQERDYLIFHKFAK